MTTPRAVLIELITRPGHSYYTLITALYPGIGRSRSTANRQLSLVLNRLKSEHKGAFYTRFDASGSRRYYPGGDAERLARELHSPEDAI